MSLFTRSLVNCLNQEPLDELVKIDDGPTYVIGIPAVQQKVNKDVITSSRENFHAEQNRDDVQQPKHESSIIEAFTFGLPPRAKETELPCIEKPDKRWQELITKEDMTDHFVIYKLYNGRVNDDGRIKPEGLAQTRSGPKIFVDHSLCAH